MRTRKQLEAALEKADTENEFVLSMQSEIQKLILEVLLDIRELLARQKGRTTV